MQHNDNNQHNDMISGYSTQQAEVLVEVLVEVLRNSLGAMETSVLSRQDLVSRGYDSDVMRIMWVLHFVGTAGGSHAKGIGEGGRKIGTLGIHNSRITQE